MKHGEHERIARWFFLFLALGIAVLFWRVMSPYLIVLATAGIVAIIVSPLDRKLRKFFKHPKLTAFVIVALLFFVVVGPLTTAAVLMTREALDLVKGTVGNPEWRATFDLATQPAFQALPDIFQERLASIDVQSVITSLASWASLHLGSVASASASFVFKTFIFFICVYYLLIDRERMFKAAMNLSPFKDEVDRSIVHRLVETVRGVIFGSLIVALVQAVLAWIGLSLFGVPGALIWASLIIIASQIPMLGTATIMVPAIIFLFVTGQVPAAIGLILWSLVVVGLVDNMLYPLVVGNRTQMHALLILLTMLGGLELFGPIGFILGPTVLAGVLVILELYKAGILEKDGIA